MSHITWLLSGFLNLLGGLAIAAIRWPTWRVQVLADLLFIAGPLVGAGNVLAALCYSRFWPILLLANALCGSVLGFFAAWQFESFCAGLGATLLGTVPSVVTFVLFVTASTNPHVG